MRKKAAIFTSLLFVFVAVFAFQSPPAEVYSHLDQPSIERVKNVCVPVSVPGLYGV